MALLRPNPVLPDQSGAARTRAGFMTKAAGETASAEGRDMRVYYDRDADVNLIKDKKVEDYADKIKKLGEKLKK